ncbi:MAG: hypothetical protein IJ191_05730 [Treponema sp.]|nr:hypothetical protein [Treponema sp.]
MAIQPIDLQTMYAQMGTVAQNVAHQQQGAKLAEGIQQQHTVQQNIEQTERVQQAAHDEAQATSIHGDGGAAGGDAALFQERKRSSDDSAESVGTVPSHGISDPRIGQHIDITR